MTRRLRHDEEGDIALASIHRLVSDPGGDLEPDAWLECVHSSVDLHVETSRENVEELPRPRMAVTDLGRSGRHSLLDHAEILSAHEMPAVALRAPGVVLGRSRRCWSVQRLCAP